MIETFPAYRIHNADGKVVGRLESLRLDDLSVGSVLVRVEYSSINYKDALAATGAGRILRSFPLVGGIDLAGEVVESNDAAFPPGSKIVAVGCGLSEVRDGGYASYARLEADMLERIPDRLDARRAMALGTAGFAAAVAVKRLETNGQRPEQGPIVVTGATGGVGSVAIALLASRGYQVVALTGKPEATAYLTTLGASEILDRNSVTLGERPLERARWAGAIDNLGGDVLSWLTRTTQPWGNIASVGLAAGATLETSVMPFILRAVSLLGVNMEVAPTLRREIWQTLATDLETACIDAIATREIGLDDLPSAFAAYLEAAPLGRTVVKLA